jgi:hypothetical protein
MEVPDPDEHASEEYSGRQLADELTSSLTEEVLVPEGDDQQTETKAVKAAEVHRVLRTTLGPTMKEHGYLRAKTSSAKWFKPVGDRYSIVQSMVSQSGPDEFSGSWFTIDFDLASSPEAHAYSSRAQRIWRYLTPEVQEDLRAVQEQIYDDLASRVEESRRGEVEEERRSRHGSQSDFPMRYYSPADVQRWADFVDEVMPEVLEHAESRDE